MSEMSGLPGIWQDLSSYLSVSTELSEQPAESDFPVMVRFTVTNTARIADDQPEIHFEEVVLKVGTPPDWHVEHRTDLAGGGSFAYEHRCSYNELAKLQYAVQGKVSPIALLKIHQTPRAIYIKSPCLTLSAYARFFNENDIFRWLETLRTLPIPGANTTLADLEAQKRSIKRMLTEIADTENNLQRILGFIITTENRDKIIENRRLIEEYFRRLKEGCGRVDNLLSTPTRGEHIAGERDRILARLENEKSRISHAIAGLLPRPATAVKVPCRYPECIQSENQTPEQRLRSTFPEESWSKLPELARRSLVNLDRAWLGDPSARIESILNELRIAVEQLLLDGLWRPLESWVQSQPEGARQEFLLFKAGLLGGNTQPDLLQFEQLCQNKATDEFLKAKGVPAEDRHWFVTQLPASLRGLRQARNQAEHDVAKPWTREQLKPFVNEYLGIDHHGILQRMAGVLFSAST